MKVNFKLILIFGFLFSFTGIGLWIASQFIYVNDNVKNIIDGITDLLLGLMILNIPQNGSKESNMTSKLIGYFVISVGIFFIFISIISFFKMII